MKTLLSILLLLSLALPASAQLHVNWTRFVGRDSCCSAIQYAIPSRDGNIVFTGYTGALDWVDTSTSGDMPGTSWGGGVFVGKMDSNHNILWLHIYGGGGGYCICQTADNGYAIVAGANGDYGYVTGYHGGGEDLWLFKIDSVGNFMWGNCFGSCTASSMPMSLAITKDNGYILLGATNGSDCDVPYHIGTSEFQLDWFVVKTDSTGHKQWAKDLGGSQDELGSGYGTILTADTGYYLIGSSASTDHDCIDTTWHSGVNTNYDYYVLHLNDTGHVIWAKSFGGSNIDMPYNAIWDYRDSTIVINGYTVSNNYMVSGLHGSDQDFWVIKVSKNGNLIWQKTLGGGANDFGTSIAITDSGYVAFGSTGTLNEDLWMFDLDKNGNIYDNIIFGGTNEEIPGNAFPYKNGFITNGLSASIAGFTDGNNCGTMGWGERGFVSYINKIPVYINKIAESMNTFTIYPNPTNEFIFFNSTEIGKITIINYLGQQMLSKKINHDILKCTVHDWANGLYIAQWQGEDGYIITTKFIKN